MFPPAAKPFDWSGQRKDWGDSGPTLFSVASREPSATEKPKEAALVEKPPAPFLFGQSNGSGKEKTTNGNGATSAAQQNTNISALFTIGPAKDAAAGGAKAVSSKPPPAFIFGDSGKAVSFDPSYVSRL